jgi:hypothetical protein
MRTQVTFDAADPHALAAFWADVLGCDVEDHSGSPGPLPRSPACTAFAAGGEQASAVTCDDNPAGLLCIFVNSFLTVTLTGF